VAEKGQTGREADAAADPDDDMRRKFRDALQRKHDGHGETAAGGDSGAGKIHGAHGPAANRREFRRKSG